MSGQQKIQAAPEKAVQCHPRTAGQVVRFVSRQQVERMMRYHDLLDAIGKPAKPFFHPQHLPLIDTAASNDSPPGGIHTGNCDFIVHVEGFQVIGNILPIDLEPASKPRIDVIQRDVMISRHNDLRRGKRPQEPNGPFELAWPRTLRKVARNGHYVGLGLVNRLNEPLDHGVIGAPEVHIGKMD